MPKMVVWCGAYVYYCFIMININAIILREAGAGGSNPLTPTIKTTSYIFHLVPCVFFMFHKVSRLSQQRNFSAAIFV